MVVVDAVNYHRRKESRIISFLLLNRGERVASRTRVKWFLPGTYYLMPDKVPEE